jgi:ArsR family transcriptional regulator, arsenate/arsenite/antimonite-responsive transcriptional repressor / arsenate reductase (thioredoxin)
MDLVDQARVHAALGDPIRLGIVAELELGDRTFQELAELLSQPGNLLAHHLGVLEEARLIERRVSEGDRRRRYLSLNTEPLDGLLSIRRLVARSVLFVCSHNSARSQYAAAAWRRRTGHVADSAGTHPARHLDPRAIQVALERGLDLAGFQPKGYESLKSSFDLVVSVCDRARETGPPFEAPTLHWSVPDPVAGRGLAAFRSSFNEIDRRISRLAAAAEKEQ